MHQIGVASTTAGSGIPPAAGQAMSSLGLTSGYLAGDRGTATSDNHSQEPPFFDEAIESRPQLLYTKFQRLKNTTKLAKVILVDEVPFVRWPRNANGHQAPNSGSLEMNTDRQKNQAAETMEF